MTKYQVQQIVRVLILVSVEADNEDEALVAAENQIYSFLPENNPSVWVLGFEDDSEKAALETEETLTISDVGYEILGKEGKL